MKNMKIQQVTHYPRWEAGRPFPAEPMVAIGEASDDALASAMLSKDPEVRAACALELCSRIYPDHAGASWMRAHLSGAVEIMAEAHGAAWMRASHASERIAWDSMQVASDLRAIEAQASIIGVPSLALAQALELSGLSEDHYRLSVRWKAKVRHLAALIAAHGACA